MNDKLKDTNFIHELTSNIGFQVILAIILFGIIYMLSNYLFKIIPKNIVAKNSLKNKDDV